MQQSNLGEPAPTHVRMGISSPKQHGLDGGCSEDCMELFPEWIQWFITPITTEKLPIIV
jgi:hypothetical protein